MACRGASAHKSVSVDVNVDLNRAFFSKKSSPAEQQPAVKQQPIEQQPIVEQQQQPTEQQQQPIVKDDKKSTTLTTEPTDIVDPWCNPDRPIKLQYDEVVHAAEIIGPFITRTPCVRSEVFSQHCSLDLYFKKEFMQVTGSFKERGARYTLMRMTKEQQAAGIVAASAGNHALALCYHGYLLSVPVTVVMPKVSPLMKVQRCRTYGANVIVKGNTIREAKNYALQLTEETGATYINGFDHPHILAGQGTMALEILEQVPDVDAIIVPVGGGGLVAGIATVVKRLKPECAVIAVEAAACPSFSDAMKAGKLVTSEPKSSLADGAEHGETQINVAHRSRSKGLAVSTVGVNSFESAKDLVDKTLTVSEEHIALAILRLIEYEKAVVEGAGAVGVAALLSGQMPELYGKKVVVPLCGGNIDTTALGRTIERGLAADGRLVRFTVTVSDRPGGFAQLSRIVADTAASIKDTYCERAWLMDDVFSVKVKMVLETISAEHVHQVQQALETCYGKDKVKLNMIQTDSNSPSYIHDP